MKSTNSVNSSKPMKIDDMSEKSPRPKKNVTYNYQCFGKVSQYKSKILHFYHYEMIQQELH